MSDSPQADPPFEQALAELEKIVRVLEEGEVSLEEALAGYERGVGLLKVCYAHLQKVEQRIKQLGVDDEDRPVARPFAHAPATENTPRKPPPRRDEAF